MALTGNLFDDHQSPPIQYFLKDDHVIYRFFIRILSCDSSSCSSFHAPSLVVLDDLDKIAPAVEGDDAGPFNAQAAHIAEKLEDLLMSGMCLVLRRAVPAFSHKDLSQTGYISPPQNHLFMESHQTAPPTGLSKKLIDSSCSRGCCSLSHDFVGALLSHANRHVPNSTCTVNARWR